MLVSKSDNTEVTHNTLPGKPKIVLRDSHIVSRRNIDPDALKVLRRLNGYGYQAFLVGGGVRDLLLGKLPKDFDIGTNARPEEVRELFRNSRIIGRRFKLIHIYFKGGKIIEVSTFRSSVDSPEDSTATLAHDNNYGDAESDALRRDLTINGLFYNAEDFSIIDYVGGISDLDKKIVRIIGDPDIRLTEDPVRIIRASRHAARADFSIDSKTSAAMKRHIALLNVVPSSRIYEEFLKDLYSGAFRKTFVRHRKYGIIKQLLPKLEASLSSKSEEELFKFYERIDYLDNLISSGNDPLSELFYAILILGNMSEKSFKNVLIDEWTDFEKLSFVSQENFVLTHSETLKENSTIEISPPDSYFKIQPVKRDRSRERVGSLAKEIGKWFLPLTLTKREKIALERLLLIRRRILTASSDNINQVSELINSLHFEERENLNIIFDIFNSEIPRGLRGALSSDKRRKNRYKKFIDPSSVSKGKNS